MPAESRAEELAAYAIDYREAAPFGIRAAIDNIVGAVKAWLLKTFGVQLGAVTPGELVALAKAALRDGWQPTDGGPEGGPDGGSKENRLIQKTLRSIIDAAWREKSGQVADLKVKLKSASSAVVRMAKRNSRDIDGYVHVIDGSGVRHIYKEHASKAGEAARGQLVVTPRDVEMIPDVIENPDAIVFGFTTRTGRPGIGYIKKMSASSTLFVEEARAGQRELAATSMRKYPPTTHVDDVVSTLRPNVKNDGGAAIKVVDLTSQGKDRKFNLAAPPGSIPSAPPKLTMKERTSNLLTSAIRGDSKGDHGLLSMTPLRQLVQEIAFPFQTPRGRPLIHAGPQGLSATSALRPHCGR